MSTEAIVFEDREYIILICQKCGEKIMVFKNYGKHKCPNCKAEFETFPLNDLVIKKVQIKWKNE